MISLSIRNAYKIKCLRKRKRQYSKALRETISDEDKEYLKEKISELNAEIKLIINK